MAVTAARTSYGGKFQADFAGGTNYADFAEIYAIHPPGITVPGHDASNLQSPSATKEFLPGMINPGKATFDMRFTAAAYILLLASLRVRLNWRILAPLGAGKSTPMSTTFYGHIDSLPPPIMPEDGVIQLAGVSVMVSGVVTFTNES